MNNLTLIATELSNMGFETKVTHFGVLVSLSTRTISTMEVEQALVQAFEGIRFQVSKHNKNIVLVRE